MIRCALRRTLIRTLNGNKCESDKQPSIPQLVGTVMHVSCCMIFAITLQRHRAIDQYVCITFVSYPGSKERP